MKNEDEFLLIDLATGKTHGNYSLLGEAANKMHTLVERDPKARFVIAHVLLKQRGLELHAHAWTATDKAIAPVDTDDLKDLELAAEELVAAISAIRQVASTSPQLVDALLASVEYGLTAQAACINTLRSGHA